MVDSSSTVNQLNLIVIRLRTRTESMSFSSLHGAFTKMDHILGHKAHLNALEM